jgi:hypothetical protein
MTHNFKLVQPSASGAGWFINKNDQEFAGPFPDESVAQTFISAFDEHGHFCKKEGVCCTDPYDSGGGWSVSTVGGEDKECNSIYIDWDELPYDHMVIHAVINVEVGENYIADFDYIVCHKSKFLEQSEALVKRILQHFAEKGWQPDDGHENFLCSVRGWHEDDQANV